MPLSAVTISRPEPESQKGKIKTCSEQEGGEGGSVEKRERGRESHQGG